MKVWYSLIYIKSIQITSIYQTELTEDKVSNESASGIFKNKIKNVKGKPSKINQRLPWPRFKLEEDGKISLDKKGNPVELGVDVVEKKKDIIKLVHKFFSVSEIPMEELLQEVYLTVIHKNHSKSAHDPTKSSFGHYIYMIANNVCIGLVHKKKRFEKERDSLDTPIHGGGDDERTILDRIEVEPEYVKSDSFHDKMEELEAVLRNKGMWDLARYIRVARSGADADVVKATLSHKGKEVTKKTIREMRHELQEIVRLNSANFFAAI